MDEFFQILNSQSDRLWKAFAQPRVAIVTSSDPQTATARALIQPEGVLTGWLPVLTQWAGAGWGISCPPCQGDQVLILPQEGDAQHGIIIGRFFSNSTRPPDADCGEIMMRHETGSSIRLLNSGAIAVQGDLHVTGDVYDTHGALSKLRNDYNAHIHQTSNGQSTSVPLVQD